MPDRKRNWLSVIINGGNERTPDLVSRRAINPNSNRVMPHAVSRHCDIGETPIRFDGGEFKQGGTFPAYVKPGDIRKMQRIVYSEFRKYLKGRSSNVLTVQDAGGAYRITVKLNKFGVEIVGSFIRNGKVATVFPENE